MRNLGYTEFARLVDETPEVVILDVRTKNEFDQGHIKGAINLDIMRGTEFMEGLEKLDKDKVYLVYCRSGNRSGAACGAMEKLGFKDTVNFAGGILDWEGELV